MGKLGFHGDEDTEMVDTIFIAWGAGIKRPPHEGNTDYRHDE